MRNLAVQPKAQETTTIKSRRLIADSDPAVFSAIYEDDCNIAVWQRQLPAQLTANVVEFLKSHTGLQAAISLAPEKAFESIHEALGNSELTKELSQDIAELVDMFSCLFELERVGLRLTVLDKAMCPKFHVDKVPCRMVTTYQGTATEWLPHNNIDRSKLGAGSEGKSDEESGLMKSSDDIQRLTSGDVALLKGERWEGNEGAGLVHRSPALAINEVRVLLTLDFA